MKITRTEPQDWPEGHRQCNKCFAVKAFAEFPAKAGGRFGIRATCRSCTAVRQNAYYAANKAVLIAYQQTYRVENKERRSAQRKAHHIANKAAIAARNKARYDANRAAEIAKSRARYEANKQTYLANKRADYLAKREVYRARNKAYLQTLNGQAAAKTKQLKRRTRARFAFDAVAVAADFQHWLKEGSVCYLTGIALLPGAVTLDHVVPIHWGGTADKFNILPASLAANVSKRESLVYFDLVTREARFTTDPCPGGIGPNGETWPRIPLTQPSLDDMQALVDAWKTRRLANAA